MNNTGDNGAIDSLLVVSDPHFGSTLSPRPAYFDTLDGETTGSLNKATKWLLDSWNDCVAQAREKMLSRNAALLCNGDMIDGNHHKTWQLVSPSATVHEKIAVEMLRPLAEAAKKVMMVRGTACHVGTSSESNIGKELGAEFCAVSKSYSRFQWLFDIQGCIISCHHHMPTSRRPWLYASSLGAELVSEQCQAMAAGHPVPDMIVRSHRHVYGFYQSDTGAALVSPSFQLPTEYVHAKVTAAISSLGMMWCEWEEGRKLPFVTPITVNPPKPMIVKL